MFNISHKISTIIGYRFTLFIYLLKYAYTCINQIHEIKIRIKHVFCHLFTTSAQLVI